MHEVGMEEKGLTYCRLLSSVHMYAYVQLDHIH